MRPGGAGRGLTCLFSARHWLDVAWRSPLPGVVGSPFGSPISLATLMFEYPETGVDRRIASPAADFTWLSEAALSWSCVPASLAAQSVQIPGHCASPRSRRRFMRHRPAAGCLPGNLSRRERLYGFGLEPEVRAWLDSLSDSDFKRVDEVCGMLAGTCVSHAGRNA